MKKNQKKLKKIHPFGRVGAYMFMEACVVFTLYST